MKNRTECGSCLYLTWGAYEMRLTEWADTVNATIRLDYTTTSQWSATIGPCQIRNKRVFLDGEVIDSTMYSITPNDALQALCNKISLNYAAFPIYDVSGREVGEFVVRIPVLDLPLETEKEPTHRKRAGWCMLQPTNSHDAQRQDREQRPTKGSAFHRYEGRCSR